MSGRPCITVDQSVWILILISGGRGVQVFFRTVLEIAFGPVRDVDATVDFFWWKSRFIWVYNVGKFYVTHVNKLN